MSAHRKPNPTPPKKWLRPIPEQSRVTIAQGEADTIEGCSGIVARINQRILALTNGLTAWRAYAKTSDELDYLAGLEGEFAALHEARAAVQTRKSAIAQAIEVNFARSIRAAIRERYGVDVVREICDRARELEEDARRRHAQTLVGAVVPVGSIGGMRRRIGE